MSPSQSFTSINDSFPKVCFNVEHDEGNTFNIIAIVIFKLGICCTNVVNEPNDCDVGETSSIVTNQIDSIENEPTPIIIDNKPITQDEPNVITSDKDPITQDDSIEKQFEDPIDPSDANSNEDDNCSSSTYLSDEYTPLLDNDCCSDSS